MGPFGHFIFNSEGEGFFVATGTGFAPFRSMILTELEKGNKNNLTLLWGHRNIENIYLQKELEELSEKYSNFKYIITLSQPDESWKGAKGRVTAHLQEMQIPPEAAFYLCGIKAMIDDSKEILINKGVAPERIFFEKY